VRVQPGGVGARFRDGLQVLGVVKVHGMLRLVGRR
jgi:hypothetical protein